ncbi:putative gag-polypeptide of LTR copia-type [Rosa chinensis]|uniref:Putative gag-polypeptide of LTR copia-type n=1 Tax=Rosa chinensis TaxID=74649 RepID=A0A2P6P8K8_ROSCH|nr:putative gag-polypeptide of LTR copia-type [Rosa chinensis]
MVATAVTLLANLSSIISVKLDDNNYPIWHFQLYSLLRGHGLLKFVDGTVSCPSQYTISDDGSLTSTPSEDYEDWLEQDWNLASLITATLSPEALSHVVGCNSALEVWTTLKDRYATVSRANVVQLKSNL